LSHLATSDPSTASTRSDLLCGLTTTCQLPPVHYTLASTQFSSATWGTCTFYSPAPSVLRSASPTPCTFPNATYVPDSFANGFLYLLVSKRRYYNCGTAPTRSRSCSAVSRHYVPDLRLPNHPPLLARSSPRQLQLALRLRVHALWRRAYCYHIPCTPTSHHRHFHSRFARGSLAYNCTSIVPLIDVVTVHLVFSIAYG